MNFYEVLGVSRNATPEEITKAYRAKAIKLHPDANPDPAAMETFKKVAEAYETLIDPGKRVSYNHRNPETFVSKAKPVVRPKKETKHRGSDPNFGPHTIKDIPQSNKDIWGDIRQEMEEWDDKKAKRTFKDSVWTYEDTGMPDIR